MAADDRLDSWKEIAAYLKRDVTTVQWLVERTDYFWRNPLNDAQFQNVTDFGGAEQAAVISRDGRFVAFLSDRDGRMDVWVTQIGAGQSYNLTRGRVRELVNPSVRTLGFSPDGALVTFWARGVDGSNARDIAVRDERRRNEGTGCDRIARVARRSGLDARWTRDHVGCECGRHAIPLRISLSGAHVPLVQEYCLDPVWSPDGDFLVYSGADIGTTFPVKAVTAAGKPYPIPSLTLTRVARRLRFFHGQRALVVMRGEIQHKNLWLIDLERSVS
jgi:WD40 repeat protein